MARCDACGASILFGGAKLNDMRFCNATCAQRGQLLMISRQLPADMVTAKTSEVYRGTCPRCQGPGPVDVHTSHRVWSALIMTQWQNRPHVCCHSCGVKSQAGDLLFSLFLGWWGFPWGLIMTPVQITRNISGMMKSSEGGPSPELEKAVRISLAGSAARQGR